MFTTLVFDLALNPGEKQQLVEWASEIHSTLPKTTPDPITRPQVLLDATGGGTERELMKQKKESTRRIITPIPTKWMNKLLDLQNQIHTLLLEKGLRFQLKKPSLIASLAMGKKQDWHTDYPTNCQETLYSVILNVSQEVAVVDFLVDDKEQAIQFSTGQFVVFPATRCAPESSDMT